MRINKILSSCRHRPFVYPLQEKLPLLFFSACRSPAGVESASIHATCCHGRRRGRLTPTSTTHAFVIITHIQTTNRDTVTCPSCLDQVQQKKKKLPLSNFGARVVGCKRTRVSSCCKRGKHRTRWNVVETWSRAPTHVTVSAHACPFIRHSARPF